MDEDDMVPTAVVAVVTLGAGLAAKKVLGAAWGKARGQVPGDADADVSWREAAVFAIVSGAVVGTARLIAQRGTVLAFGKKSDKQTTEAVKDAAPTA